MLWILLNYLCEYLQNVDKDQVTNTLQRNEASQTWDFLSSPPWPVWMLFLSHVTVWVKGKRQTADPQRMDIPVLQRD